MVRKPSYAALEQVIASLEEEVGRYRQDISLLQADHSRLQAILESAISAIVMVNDQGLVLEWPPQAELLCGWARNEMIGQPISRIMPPRHRKMHKTLMADVLAGKRGENFGKRIETTIFYRDEFEVPVELAVTLTRTADRQEFTLFMHDITERKNYEAQLHHRSITDELTGLFNRRGFIALANQQLKIASRSKENVYLLYADFDNMKWINDNLGHQTGDNALIETAVILKNTFRQADLIGRVGGDEFIVLMTDHEKHKDEETVVKRLEKEIEKANAMKNRSYQIMLSVGTVAYKYDRRCSIDDLMIKADQLMYENKREKKENGNYNHY